MCQALDLKQLSKGQQRGVSHWSMGAERETARAALRDLRVAEGLHVGSEIIFITLHVDEVPQGWALTWI